jgi:membrane protease YdiL (CAAX protease family)
VREAIRRLSPRSEFFLVLALCFGYFVVSSAIVLFLGVHQFNMTTGRVIRGVLVELALMAISAWVLHVRGWDFGRLGLRFSWPALLAGVPLFIAYIVLYWGTFLLAVRIYPDAQRIQVMKMIPAAPFSVFVIFIVINSLFEEAAVTGYVVTALSDQGAPLSITASALIRLLYHLYQGPIASISVLPLGLLFALVYWRWRNLWPLMTAHTIANLLSFAAASR